MSQWRICAFPDCKETISERMLMCSKHWCLVPASLREKIRATFDSEAPEAQAVRRQAAAESHRRMAAAVAVPQMRGLTLIQPMGWALIAGHKPVENREWPLPKNLINRPFCLHGGKKYDKAYDRDCRELLGLAGLPPQAHDQGILGVVAFDRCVDIDAVPPGDPMLDCPWFSGRYGWWAAKVLAFAEPVPCPGAQGPWHVPPEVAKEVWYRVQVSKALKE